MFDFLTPLKPHHFNQTTEYLIDGFIAKRVITLIYSPGGSGKSWLATAIAKHAALNGMKVLYLDYDNSKDALESRNLADKLLKPCPSLHYELGGQSLCSAQELLDRLEEEAHGNRFENTLVVFDTLTEFVKIGADAHAQAGLRKIKRLRDAGATVILLHHSTKSGSSYQGSGVIRNAIDNMFHLQAIEAGEGEVRHLLTIEKDRVRIVDTAICTRVLDLSMMPINLAEAQMSEDEKDFVRQVKALLLEQPGINKTDLLDALGYKPDHKQARDRLDQFEDIYWRTEKGQKNATLFFILENNNTDKTDKTQ